MRIVRSVAEMQRLAKKIKASGRAIGLVPTMGCLHAGHISLVYRARKVVGKRGQVIVSIFVNPTQFAPHEDLAKYPRDFKQDEKLCREAGVDILFFPAQAQMYPGNFSTFISEGKLSRGMEGVSRPTHFRGVATVVAKLFNIVLPDAAIFGAKDFQQAAIIQRMVRDLNFPLKIVIAPTQREPDGLAMSSRNQFLTARQRERATVLVRAIQSARKIINIAPVSPSQLKRNVAKLISAEPEASLDYVEFFDPKTLEPVKEVARGSQMALGVFFGKTRLIDNGRL